MNITLKSIPHDQQRYETAGDWKINPDGSIEINVSDMGNEDYNFLVALHELVEVWLCQKRGIKDEDVTKFDIAFEESRGKNDNGEPGDEPDAPYQNEHLIATGVEKIVAASIGVKWKEYDDAVNAL